jgi:hypothetical protein
MIEVNGVAGISAKILCDSINEAGNRLTTFELVYPRIIHAELLTHGMLCRNAASSRAIPFAKMQEQLTGKPVRFGAANKGMVDAGEHNELINGMYTPEEWWHLAKLSASNFARGYYEAGYAKQIFNRPTEAFQMMKTVLSATEYDNYYWLRDDKAADPTLEVLAHTMKQAHEQSVPRLLRPGHWHTPYVAYFEDGKGGGTHWITDADNNVLTISTEDAIKVSAARCGAVSFRNEDYGLEQCLRVNDKLVGDDRKHASAFQHQATPMKKMDERNWTNIMNAPSSWEAGISHMDCQGSLWSAQYKGWVMNRKLIPGENYQGT